MTVVELVHTANLLNRLQEITPKQQLRSAGQRVEPAHVSSRPALSDLPLRALSLARELERGLWEHAVSRGGASDSPLRLAYEVDGFGGRLMMDDANLPSLLSLPYLGFLDLPRNRYLPLRANKLESERSVDDFNLDEFDWAPIYAATRPLLLDPSSNPWYFRGEAGEGMGGPHVGWAYAWPLAITARALTAYYAVPKDGSDSDDTLAAEADAEVAACLALLVSSSAGTGLLHESFNVNDVADFTRPWFAWANGLFAELVMQLVEKRPGLVLRKHLRP